MRDQKVESSSVDIDRIIHVVLNRESLQNSINYQMLPVRIVEIAVSLKVILLQEMHLLSLINEELWLILTKLLVL